MGTILKIFISIIRFIWKKLGVPGILFLVILVVVPVGVNSFDRASDDYAYEDQWEVNSYRIDKKEMTEDVKAHFTEWELDEEYGKKCIYQVQVMVTNTGVNPIHIRGSFYGVSVKDEEGYSYFPNVKDYYYEMDEYDRLNTSVIAPRRTMPVYFLFVFDEDDVPEELNFYQEYEGDLLFTIQVPKSEIN